MNEFSPLQRLVIEEISRLGQEAHRLYQEAEQWRETPLTDMQKTEFSVKIKGCLERQREWINALLEESE
jgi:hypothetical protein